MFLSLPEQSFLVQVIVPIFINYIMLVLPSAVNLFLYWAGALGKKKGIALLWIKNCTQIALANPHTLYRWITLPELRGEQRLRPFTHSAHHWCPLPSSSPVPLYICPKLFINEKLHLRSYVVELWFPPVFQVLEGLAGDPWSSDMFQAAWLCSEYWAGTNVPRLQSGTVLLQQKPHSFLVFLIL